MSSQREDCIGERPEVDPARTREERPIDPAQIRTAKSPGWKAQFGHPRGLAGRLAGLLMARKNAYIHRLVVELLEPREGDRILEIGFGSGTVVRELARRVSGGLVAGIDVSEEMLRQASRRNRAAIRDGRVSLRKAGVSSIPWPDGAFTKVCESNTIHHWPDPRRDLLEIRRVLAPEGLLLLALRMKAAEPGRFKAPGHDEDSVRRILRVVEEAGFGEVRVERRRLAREVVCVIARR